MVSLLAGYLFFATLQKIVPQVYGRIFQAKHKCNSSSLFKMTKCACRL
jgi:hypothetical protein